MPIRPLQPPDHPEWFRLRRQLFADDPPAQLRREMDQKLTNLARE